MFSSDESTKGKLGKQNLFDRFRNHVGNGFANSFRENATSLLEQLFHVQDCELSSGSFRLGGQIRQDFGKLCSVFIVEVVVWQQL